MCRGVRYKEHATTPSPSILTSWGAKKYTWEEKWKKKKNRTPGPTYVNPELHLTTEQEFFEKFIAWKCSFSVQIQSPRKVQKHMWIKKTEYHQCVTPTNESQQRVRRNVSSFLKAREGTTLTLFNLASSLSLLHTPTQQSKLKCVEQLA